MLYSHTASPVPTSFVFIQKKGYQPVSLCPRKAQPKYRAEKTFNPKECAATAYYCQQCLTHKWFLLTQGRRMLLRNMISKTMISDKTLYRLRMIKALNHPSPKRSLTANCQ